MVTRISGLASGMDIDSMVKGLMDAQRVPLDKLYQKKTYTEWQRDDYRTMNTALSELDKLIFDGIGKQSSFNKKTVSISNENAVSIKNVTSTSDFAGTINVTSGIATAATMISTAPTTVTSAQTQLKDLGLTGTQTITIKAINKDGGFDKVLNADGTPSTTDKVISLEFKDTDTIQSVINKINADSGATVFFDEKSKQFSITAKNTGYAGSTAGTAAIQLTGAIFTNVMNMSDNSFDAKTAGHGTEGSNVTLEYNGMAITRSSNTFTINGAEITLKQGNTGPITFSSSPDVDAIYDTIKKFVDSYNGLIANISDKITEKKNSDYAPLTDAQKKDMSEDEIKLWETQAKKGTLRNDSTLSSLLTKMRTSIYSSVSNTSFNNLAKIGISTTKDYSAGGKLEIDEEKLRAAIAKDPNEVYKLFMSDGDQTSEQGVARRLRADLKSAMTDISDKAGKTSSVNNTFTLGRLLDDYEDKISAFEERMTNLENRYYKQFTAMEKAMQQANSQSSSLTSFFSSQG